MPTRRVFLSDLALALAAAGCSTSGPATDAQPETSGPTAAKENAAASRLKLTAYHVPSLCLAGSRVALLQGYFAAEGLDVDLLPADVSSAHQHEATAAWVLGPNGRARADITTIEYPALVEIVQDKLDYYVVAGEHSGCRQLVVPSGSPVQTLAELKGKRIGLPPFNDRVMWDYLIRQAGVDPESVRWVPNMVTPGGDEEVAHVKEEFSAGRLDAYVTVDPAGEILKAGGVVRLLASNTWTAPLNGWYCCMIAVRREVIDAHPEVAGAVTRAYRQAAAFIEQHATEAVALSVKAGYMSPGTDQVVSARLIGEYVWTGTGRIEEDLERYFRLLIEAGRLPASPPPRELVARVYRGGGRPT